MRRILAVVVAAIVLVATPAWAGTVTYDDAVGDTHSRSDIKRVVVEHVHTADRLKVTTRLTRVVYGAELAVYVDSRRRNSGPEWKISAYADSEWRLLKVRRWRDEGTEVTTCGRVSYSRSTDRPVARVVVPSSCLLLHRDVSVAVRIRDPGHGKDWAPAERTFLPPA